MSDFRSELRRRILVQDGAKGTMLQSRGLAPGACPEEMNIRQPEIVTGIHREYALAGADIIVTNTFGGNRVKLANYHLESKLYDINAFGVEAARRAAGPERFVAGSVGPTGRFMEPEGDASFDEMLDIFSEQLRALHAAGVDLVTFETFLDIRELRAAVIAWHDLCSLPCMALMTFDAKGRTVLGSTPQAAAVTLEGLGADVVGANCGLGVEGIREMLGKMREVTSLPLISQPNAGLPQLRDGKTFFPGTPREMIAAHEQLAALGVRVMGGCCGTTPDFIRAISEDIPRWSAPWEAPQPRTLLSSRENVVAIGPDCPCAIIGERINPTGRKRYAQELREGKTAYIRAEAAAQQEAGAVLLDLNCGTPGVDEALAMERAVYAASAVTKTPLVLDSSSPQALERGLKAVAGRALINSVSGEEKSLEVILPLAKRYGAAVIGLCLDSKGIPPEGAARAEIARRIVSRAQDYGIAPHNLLIDCLTMAVATGAHNALHTLEALRLVKNGLGLNTVLGVSNISFGLPGRPIISSVFLTMALEAGLSAAIINPKESRMMEAFRASMALLAKDPQAQNYVTAFQDIPSPAANPAPAPNAEPPSIRERLARAVIEGDKDGVPALVEEALKEGLAPLAIGNEGLLPGLEEIGRRFGKGTAFLPQMMRAAETMQTAFARLRQEMKGLPAACRGKVLMATVEGDIHDIGKNIVCALLENHGFEVIDLGKNVPASRILETALAEKVDAVGLSALMTTTLAKMNETIRLLREKGVPVVAMVGGAVVTKDYADQIGADIYGADAVETVEKLKRIMENRETAQC
ncbi:MAG: homocysteine S-methyltransferase family protein [Deltaproteobacteria bacterium]|nr:homocysteine S-methyltransferase family protein [Deltaproteobacteria bacterium]